jgi:hypothetical protein
VQGVRPCAWAVSSRAVHEHGLGRSSARLRALWLQADCLLTEA